MGNSRVTRRDWQRINQRSDIAATSALLGIALVLADLVDHSIDADATVRLDRIAGVRGEHPEFIRCDNGPASHRQHLRHRCRFGSPAPLYRARLALGEPWVESHGSHLRHLQSERKHPPPHSLSACAGVTAPTSSGRSSRDAPGGARARHRPSALPIAEALRRTRFGPLVRASADEDGRFRLDQLLQDLLHQRADRVGHTTSLEPGEQVGRVRIGESHRHVSFWYPAKDTSKINRWPTHGSILTHLHHATGPPSNLPAHDPQSQTTPVDADRRAAPLRVDGAHVDPGPNRDAPMAATVPQR